MIKLGIIGGHRGFLLHQLLSFTDNMIKITAIADHSSQILSEWKNTDSTIHLYDNHTDLLTRGDCEAVYIATPINQHFKQTLDALYAGKHVLCAVPSCTELDECYQLIRAVEASKRTYMLAENYCFIPENIVLSEMCKEQWFGPLTYIRGAYIHDCKELMFDNDRLTWRGDLNRIGSGNIYPTHTIGPISQWLNINQNGGDRFSKIWSFSTLQHSLTAYAIERYGSDHQFAQSTFFKRGDANITFIETKNGALIEIVYDTHSNRPSSKSEFLVQGINGCYVSGRFTGEEGLAWFKNKASKQFKPLSYYKKYHDAHINPDLVMFREFINAIESNRAPAIDVYEAVTWSSIIPLSKQSENNGHRTIDFPNFKS